MASELKEDFMDLRVPSRMNSSCKRQREREKYKTVWLHGEL